MEEQHGGIVSTGRGGGKKWAMRWEKWLSGDSSDRVLAVIASCVPGAVLGPWPVISGILLICGVRNRLS